jgi:sporulation protein YlmC with PRC-barrel domain
MRSILATTAVALLVAMPASAETTNMAPTTQTAPQAATSTTTPAVKFYSERGDWRASNLMGLKVTNAANETIGDINEILFDNDGKIAAIVIGVGGFLGMGERHAAVEFGSVQLTRDKSNAPLARVNVTKEQLKSAPEWKWQAASVN